VELLGNLLGEGQEPDTEDDLVPDLEVRLLLQDLNQPVCARIAQDS